MQISTEHCECKSKKVRRNKELKNILFGRVCLVIASVLVRLTDQLGDFRDPGSEHRLRPNKVRVAKNEKLGKGSIRRRYSNDVEKDDCSVFLRKEHTKEVDHKKS